ncbi:hypothetical protein BCV53_01585 [Parageobacillus thermoglucosidasius]|uniref:Uncharacterized protein n=1 Tax=Parageobacillus thermoglucosidasius TaxID=1426 RepID=A0AAN1D586_PARTM|nr:hypothetical protein AOT13_01580 [Parageobacillus thermoglucosidasius]ANZ28919.1 hypothetical protein BCV53_01585 [Parageobacillus thermoglucosidasius]APM79658.1 hypothetical protein BCV54_01595 [Parageobacillus thermoglucosidasius]KJX69426.1 hypothetical protein WH82_06620 [Parageobacillus thermoglucosidasius]RDE23106.1 hypothetical protein DV712_08000 [Parageobacillus thermoglucosidasius]
MPFPRVCPSFSPFPFFFPFLAVFFERAERASRGARQAEPASCVLLLPCGAPEWIGPEFDGRGTKSGTW